MFRYCISLFVVASTVATSSDLESRDDSEFNLVSPTHRTQLGSTCFLHAGATFLRSVIKHHFGTEDRDLKTHQFLMTVFQKRMELFQSKNNSDGSYHPPTPTTVFMTLDDILQDYGLRAIPCNQNHARHQEKLDEGVPMIIQMQSDFYLRLTQPNEAGIRLHDPFIQFLPEQEKEISERAHWMVIDPERSEYGKWAIKDSQGNGFFFIQDFMMEVYAEKEAIMLIYAEDMGWTPREARRRYGENYVSYCQQVGA